MSEPPTFRLEKIPVRKRCVLAGDSARRVDFVFCTNRGRTESLEDCASCRHLWKIPADIDQAESFIECVPLDGAVEVAGNDPRDPLADVRQAALRTRILDVVDRDVVCVREDASLEMARALLLSEHGRRCLPVVDESAKLVGIVTHSDLLSDDADQADGAAADAPRDLGHGFHVEELAHRTVGDLMTRDNRALPADAPLAAAVSLMAFDALLDVPVVSEDGAVIGVVTSLDVVRWLAERL